MESGAADSKGRINWIFCFGCFGCVNCENLMINCFLHVIYQSSYNGRYKIKKAMEAAFYRYLIMLIMVAGYHSLMRDDPIVLRPYLSIGLPFSIFIFLTTYNIQ
jgi:hypothetical protein